MVGRYTEIINLSQPRTGRDKRRCKEEKMIAQSMSIPPQPMTAAVLPPRPWFDKKSAPVVPKMRLWPEQALLENATSQGLVWEHLGPVPWLEYRAENDYLYLVAAPNGLALTVSKDRDRAYDYLPPRGNRLALAFRCLGAALLGLPLAGFGAYPFLLLAWWLVGRAWAGQKLDPADQTRVQVILTISSVLFIVALTLSTLCLQRF